MLLACYRCVSRISIVYLSSSSRGLMNECFGERSIFVASVLMDDKANERDTSSTTTAVDNGNSSRFLKRKHPDLQTEQPVLLFLS